MLNVELGTNSVVLESRVYLLGSGLSIIPIRFHSKPVCMYGTTIERTSGSNVIDTFGHGDSDEEASQVYKAGKH